MAAHLAVWLILCGCVALVPWRNHSLGIIGVLLVVLFVPTSAAQDFTGVAFDAPTGAPSLSAATWLLLAVACVYAVHRRRHLVGTLLALRGPIAVLLSVLAWMVL